MSHESEHTKLNEAKWDRFSEKIEGKGWRYEFLHQAQRETVALLDLKENVNVLDIGCGTGGATYQAAHRVNNAGQFYGIDLSSKMIEKAKENFRQNENFHFLKANAESIPLDSAFFDVVFSTNSFHHYLHPDKALAEIHRLLKSGGKVYIEDPTADYLVARMADRIMRWREPEHVKLYSTKEFRGLFTKAGLKYVRTATIGSWHQKVHIAEKE